MMRIATGRRSFCFGLGALAALLVGGGAGPPPIHGAKADLLSFLKEGRTWREDVILTLGQPSGAFEKERILTYRVGFDSAQGYYIVSPKDMRPWGGVRYSLVLIFEENGLLRAQKLVAVQ